MNIYVAGPMRGVPDYGYAAFLGAATRLRALGHTVFSPTERDFQQHGDRFFTPESHSGANLRDAFLDDVTWICSMADAIALLPGWEQSKGATAEAHLGFALGLRVMSVEALLAPVPLD